MYGILVTAALGLVGLVVWFRRSKRRAVEQAKQGWFYAGRHFVSAAGGVGSLLPASQLIWELRRERIIALRGTA